MGFKKTDQALELIAAVKRHRDKSISLSNSELDSVPSELGELTWLQEVSLHMNCLNEYSKGLDVFPRLKCLQSLDVSRNRFGSVPNVFGECAAIRELHVGTNQIASVPKWLSKLPLRSLVLECNPIEELPADIVYLSELEILHLMGTLLKRLPPEIGMCHRLEVLDLRGC